jgi:hypothetical protein
MDQEGFIRALKIQTSIAAVAGIIDQLKAPVGSESHEAVSRAVAWYSHADDASRSVLEYAMKEAAELAVFSFLCILDDVSVIEDGPDHGRLELHYVKDERVTLLNDPDEPELHNFFNACFADRLPEALPASIAKVHEVGEARELRKKLRIGDGMDVHHVPDKYAMSSLIRNHDSEDAPAITLPKAQHRKMPPLFR